VIPGLAPDWSGAVLTTPLEGNQSEDKLVREEHDKLARTVLALCPSRDSQGCDEYIRPYRTVKKFSPNAG